MGKKISNKMWEMKFLFAKSLYWSIDGIISNVDEEDKSEYICALCTTLRNPLLFDFDRKAIKNILPYNIGDCYSEYKDKMTMDHVIGMSSVVLYIYKNRIFEKWDCVEDFMNTYKSLNLVLSVPKYVNDMGPFKNGWKFGYDNIDEVIHWYVKFENVGIDFLVNNVTGEKIPVKDVWGEWLENHKEFLYLP